MSQLCALAGVTRQAFYKRVDGLLFRKLAIEQFVVQFVRETTNYRIQLPFGKVLARTSQGVGKVLARIKGMCYLARYLPDAWVQGFWIKGYSSASGNACTSVSSTGGR